MLLLTIHTGCSLFTLSNNIYLVTGRTSDKHRRPNEDGLLSMSAIVYKLDLKV